MKVRILWSIALLLSTTAYKAFAQQEGPANSEQEYERRYQDRIKKERLNEVYIPKNLDDALAQLDKNISPEAKLKYKNIPEDSVCRFMHRRLGQWMITNWSFYEGSRLSHYLRSAGVTYPDDMADFLLLAYHQHLHGKAVNIKDQAKSFRERRKKEFEAEKKSGKVLQEETRQRPKPAAAESKPETPKPSEKNRH